MSLLPPELPALPLREAKAPFAEAVLVCGKCARRLKGRGFGEDGRQSLRKAMKTALKATLKRGDGKAGGKTRIVETACLGLCPKRRQVAATGGMLQRRRLLVVEPGASAEGVLLRLIGPHASG